MERIKDEAIALDYTLCPEESAPLQHLLITALNLNRCKKYFTDKISQLLLKIYYIFV